MAEITVKEAIAFVREIKGEGELRDLAVEEVELSDDGRFWEITLGFLPKRSQESLAVVMGAQLGRREYKLFRVDKRTGDVQSMKIREV